MEVLIERERNARLGKDENSLRETFISMLEYCHSDQDSIHLLVLLSKRKGQLKEVLAWFIDYNFNERKTFYEKQNTNEAMNMLINYATSLLNEVIEGKMFLEKQRIMVSDYLKCTFERIGENKKALDIIFDIPIETFSTINESEIIKFQLEQLRLAILNKEWIKADVSSKKIRTKYFSESNDLENEVLFYSLLTDLNIGQKLFFNAAQLLYKIGEKKALNNKYIIYSSFYAIISDKSSERDALIKQLIYNPNNLENIRRILNAFLRDEILNVQLINPLREYIDLNLYTEEINKSIDVHNLCLISKYCTFISINYLAMLMSCTNDELIGKICLVVNDKILDCKVDENEGLVEFNKSLEVDWMNSIDNIIGKIVEVNHLIDKEYLNHNE